MAASRFVSELQFNGTGAGDSLLTPSPFARRWPNTCIQSFQLHVLPKSRCETRGSNCGFEESGVQGPLWGLDRVKTPEAVARVEYLGAFIDHENWIMLR